MSNLGRSVIFYGPMKSGKSLQLIWTAKRLEEENRKYLVFKPSIDKRDGAFIASRGSDIMIPAIMVNLGSDIIHHVKREIAERGGVSAVLVDEINLFDSGVMLAHEFCVDSGIDFFAAGLDRDFRKQWFQLGQGPETMFHLVAEYDEETLLAAKCEVCGSRAYYTQKLINGNPAPESSPLVEIGDSQYQARCSKCHQLDI